MNPCYLQRSYPHTQRDFFFKIINKHIHIYIYFFLKSPIDKYFLPLFSSYKFIIYLFIFSNINPPSLYIYTIFFFFYIYIPINCVNIFFKCFDRHLAHCYILYIINFVSYLSSSRYITKLNGCEFI